MLLFKKIFDNIHGEECVRTVKRVLIGTVEREKNTICFLSTQFTADNTSSQCFPRLGED